LLPAQRIAHEIELSQPKFARAKEKQKGTINKRHRLNLQVLNIPQISLFHLHGGTAKILTSKQKWA
jgi:hypothetical protein